MSGAAWHYAEAERLMADAQSIASAPTTETDPTLRAADEAEAWEDVDRRYQLARVHLAAASVALQARAARAAGELGSQDLDGFERAGVL